MQHHGLDAMLKPPSPPWKILGTPMMLSMKTNIYHFFRATLTKIHLVKLIIFGHRQEHLSLRFVCVKKGENAVKLQKVIFQKITESAHWEPPRKAAYSEHSIAIHSISMAGYVMAVLATVCGELLAWEASSFCDFEKLPLAISLHFLLFDTFKQIFTF